LRPHLLLALRRPAGKLLCQLGELVPSPVQLAVFLQRLSPGAPLGSQGSLDAHGRCACRDPAPDDRPAHARFALAAHHCLSGRLAAGAARALAEAKSWLDASRIHGKKDGRVSRLPLWQSRSPPTLLAAFSWLFSEHPVNKPNGGEEKGASFVKSSRGAFSSSFLQTRPATPRFHLFQNCHQGALLAVSCLVIHSRNASRLQGLRPWFKCVPSLAHSPTIDSPRTAADAWCTASKVKTRALTFLGMGAVGAESARRTTPTKKASLGACGAGISIKATRRPANCWRLMRRSDTRRRRFPRMSPAACKNLSHVM